jgi:hypothetical protein
MSQFINFPITALFLISNISPLLHQLSPLKNDQRDLAVLDFRWREIREENWPTNTWDRIGGYHGDGRVGQTTYRNKYEVTVKNTGEKVIRVVFWRYVFSHSDSAHSGEYYSDFCSEVRVKPGETKVLNQGKSRPAGPPKITDRAGRQIQISEMKQGVKIIRIEYEDGSTWTQH